MSEHDNQKAVQQAAADPRRAQEAHVQAEHEKARLADFRQQIDAALARMSDTERRIVREAVGKYFARPPSAVQQGAPNPLWNEPHAELKAREASALEARRAEIAGGGVRVEPSGIMPDNERFDWYNGQWRVYNGMVNGHASYRWLSPAEVVEFGLDPNGPATQEVAPGGPVQSAPQQPQGDHGALETGRAVRALGLTGDGEGNY